MARTQKLSLTELSILRERIQARFHNRVPGKKLTGTTYKEAYEDLRNDIILLNPEGESAVSLNRLRKLFYYTNPQFCSEDKLENPIFGKDFLSVLDNYIADEKDIIYKKDELSHSLNRRKQLIWIGLFGFSILMLFSVCFLFIFGTKDVERGWKEDFSTLSFKNLKEKGWDIWDYDATYFSKQLADSGYLTLYTLPGDYWGKPGENRSIKNFLARRIDCECCIIRVKFKNFYPYQNYQQVAIFIMARQDPRENHIKLSFTYWQPEVREVSAEKKLRGTQVIVQKNGEISDIDSMSICYANLKSVYPCPDTLQYRLTLKENRMTFQFKENPDWQVFRISKEASYPFGFEPFYIGIGAFQGTTDSKGILLNGDIIPVLIDFVEVKPCSNAD